ncbi:LPXTG cell wall anchor domain-containing protein, partial [Enterococcus faecalis]|uniref:LPXTG cell wall anchor domain-containing protein n=1 Tax=Enterococcus faecalis TaxID=1351 RepID=UPI00053530B7
VTQVPGYTGVVDDSNLGNVRITNTHTPIIKSNDKNLHSLEKNISGKSFPQTGEQWNKLFVILGMIILLGIAIVTLYRIKIFKNKG